MKRILITGAAGFIGAHVVEHLLKNTDWELVLLDKLTYASDGMSRLRDVKAFCRYRSRVQMFTADITQPISYGVMRELGCINYILHMAAETHVDNSIVNPEVFVKSNVIGTFQILQLARLIPELEKFVYFSTDEVFGPAPVTHAFQEWDRYNSTNPYSATKAAAEELCLAWSNTYSIPMLITHTMNNFGERQHPEKFIPMVIRKLLTGEKIHIHSDASKTKSGSRFYIHCRNTADAILFLLTKELLPSFPVKVIRDKFNIVGEKEMSNLSLVHLIADILSHSILNKEISPNIEMVDFHSSRPGHDLRYALDGAKMKTLGWEPPTSFVDSLEKTIRWSIDPANIRWLLMQQKQVVHS